MAEIKVSHPDVDAALKAVYHNVAEAQSLVELLDDTQDTSPFCILCRGVLDRLTTSIDNLDTELLRHGVPSLDERMPPDDGQ